MDSLNLRVRYRPIRIGWCVRNGNLEDFKTALEFTHTLWGGRYNPIIPIEKFEFAKQLVRLFKIDVLFPIDDTNELKGFIKQFPYLPWPLIGKSILNLF